jgi:hypothetical protein
LDLVGEEGQERESKMGSLPKVPSKEIPQSPTLSKCPAPATTGGWSGGVDRERSSELLLCLCGLQRGRPKEKGEQRAAAKNILSAQNPVDSPLILVNAWSRNGGGEGGGFLPPVSPSLRRLRQDVCKFKASLGNTVRPHLSDTYNS